VLKLYYYSIKNILAGDEKLSKNIRTHAVDYLFEAILSLKSQEECYTFFEDICTVNELLSLSQRFEVARMLRDHKTYLEIAEKTGASTATISRVNRSLNYGKDGYDMVFSRISDFKEDNDEPSDV
jgi:TrpR-related protein YerC/YecD